MSKNITRINQQIRPNWEMIISLAVIMITTLGTTIPLYIQSTNQIESARQDMKSFNQTIREDMKQFHEEMKHIHGRVCSIEERNQK